MSVNMGDNRELTFAAVSCSLSCSWSWCDLSYINPLRLQPVTYISVICPDAPL